MRLLWMFVCVSFWLIPHRLTAVMVDVMMDCAFAMRVSKVKIAASRLTSAVAPHAPRERAFQWTMVLGKGFKSPFHASRKCEYDTNFDVTNPHQIFELCTTSDKLCCQKQLYDVNIRFTFCIWRKYEPGFSLVNNYGEVHNMLLEVFLYCNEIFFRHL